MTSSVKSKDSKDHQRKKIGMKKQKNEKKEKNRNEKTEKWK